MSDQGETSQRVSVPEAAVLLGISVATVRRRIRAGQLRAETVHRPQGKAYVVVLGSDHVERSASDHQVGTVARLTQSPGDALAAWSATVLAPLVATIAEQAETIGRLSAELEAERRAHSPTAPNLTPDPGTLTVDTRMVRLRALAPWLLGLALAVIIVVALLVGPR